MNTQELAMNIVGKASRLLEEFARSRGIAQLEFGEDGDCALVDDRDGVTHLQIDAENGRLICLAALGEMPSPPECHPEILHDLLTANFCWGGSCGATLAIEAQSGQVVIQRSLPLAETDPGSFGRFVDEFFELTDYWEGRLAQIRATRMEDDSPFSASEDEAAAGPMIRI